ncbi:MAG: MTH938/NDUFAF3 family protein [Gammaproteobacteria bacterium]|nr:MTH938/NDUFAF3 family protein [Gammaproteobacteria bacterium]
MMQLSQATGTDRYTIHSYSDGGICILHSTSTGVSPLPETLHQSLVLTPSRLIRNWPPQQFDALATAHFAILDELQPEVLLLGCGPHQRFLPPGLQAHLAQRGIPVELMNTGAACRTYNILASDGRNIAAALLMI